MDILICSGNTAADISKPYIKHSTACSDCPGKCITSGNHAGLCGRLTIIFFATTLYNDFNFNAHNVGECNVRPQ